MSLNHFAQHCTTPHHTTPLQHTTPCPRSRQVLRENGIYASTVAPTSAQVLKSFNKMSKDNKRMATRIEGPPCFYCFFCLFLSFFLMLYGRVWTVVFPHIRNHLFVFGGTE